MANSSSKAKDIIPEGSAEDGLLLAVLTGPCDPAEVHAAWYQALSPGRRNKIRDFLQNPPREEIQAITAGDFLGDPEECRYRARQLGLKLAIP